MGRLIGPGTNEFIQAQVQKRHAKTPEGRLMSSRQKSEARAAQHPPTSFKPKTNLRNLSIAAPINI